MPESKVDVRARQAPIRQRYLDDPDSAPELLRVGGGSSDLADPLRCVVLSTLRAGVPVESTFTLESR
jgi:hypothetical protein